MGEPLEISTVRFVACIDRLAHGQSLQASIIGTKQKQNKKDVKIRIGQNLPSSIPITIPKYEDATSFVSTLTLLEPVVDIRGVFVALDYPVCKHKQPSLTLPI